MTKKNKRWGRGAAVLAILLTACMLINPLAQSAIAMADTPVEEPLPVEDEDDQILQETENAMQELPVEGSEEKTITDLNRKFLSLSMRRSWNSSRRRFQLRS